MGIATLNPSYSLSAGVPSTGLPSSDMALSELLGAFMPPV